jgi:D-beta-D-heptose 7-phosphate kinase/D-beta-D-heptose 1-phosphate adenosyltransferase
MKKIFVNGTFDIVHRGHIELLNYAKSLGDHLTIAVDVDNRVKLLKGENRPINNLHDRIFLLQNLKVVDRVFYFSSDMDLRSLLSLDEYDIMVKGSDYRDKPIIGSDLVKEVIFFDIRNEYSTTKTIQSIINRR